MPLLPVVAVGNPGHVRHHNASHAWFGNPPGLPVIARGDSGHNQWHAALDAGLGLSLQDISTAAAHAAAHNNIHPLITVGPIGTVGPHAGIVAPGGAVSISPGAGTIQAAIAANPDNTIFKCLNGSYPLSSRCEPKTGQQFYFENGATITGGGTLANGFFDVGSRNNVKIFNGTFSGFTDRSILNGSSSGWEIANNDCSGGVYALSHFSSAFVHHNKCHDTSDGPIGGFQSVGASVKDNELGPNVGGGNGQKWVGTTNLWVARNRSFQNGRTGIWLDFSNEGAIIEWNLVEDCGEHGLENEASGHTTGPIFRYNHVRNNDGTGLFISGGANTNAYGNTFENNVLAVAGFAEIQMYVNQAQINAGKDLFGNYAHDNLIIPKVGGRASVMNVDANEAARPTDTLRYIDNTANNRYDYNIYDLSNVPTGSHFWWWRTAYTWGGWRALAHIQDEHSFAA
jgi:hypothetical protein